MYKKPIFYIFIAIIFVLACILSKEIAFAILKRCFPQSSLATLMHITTKISDENELFIS